MLIDPENAGNLASNEVRVSGEWQTVNESMPARARAYQTQLTGKAGMAYAVNGVNFDGVTVHALIETKGPGYAWAVENGEFRVDYRGAGKMLNQARRQIAAANGTPIIWLVAEPETVIALQNLFKANNITHIQVVYNPAEL